MFPYTCIICGGLSDRKLDLCTECENDLPIIGNHCKFCARILPNNQEICGDCLTNEKFIQKTIALFQYKSPIDNLVLGLKFGNNLVYAKILGELLGNYLIKRYQNKIKPEIIIPVPLHKMRLQERGYNQAYELAKPVAKKLKISIDKFSVLRKKNTLAQAQLSARNRQENIRSAFSIKMKTSYRYVAVLDDVVTTGNTATEICKALSKEGINKIDIWCVARA